MNSLLDQKNPDDSASRPGHPGELLKRHRLENGWSIAEIADTLHLSKAQITALEDGDYAQLPGKTYLIGYFKNYANLTGLDISQEVVQFADRITENDRHIGITAKPRHLPSHRDRARRKIAFVLLFCSLLLFAVLWYMQQYDVTTVSLSTLGIKQEIKAHSPSATVTEIEAHSPSATVTEIKALSPSATVTVIPDSQPQTTLPVPNFGAQPGVIQNPVHSSVPAAVETDAGSSHDLVSPEPDASLPLSERTQEDNLPSAPTTPSPEAAVAVPVEPPSTDELQVAVSKQSWLDIRDATGTRIIYRTVLPGEQLVLKGKPQFSVLVGNKDGITVTYLGHKVAYTAQGNSQVARFTVGE